MVISDMSLSAISGAPAFSQAEAGGGSLRRNPVDQLRGSAAEELPELSLHGRIRFLLEDLQAKANTLRNFASLPIASDFKLAVQDLVAAVNRLPQTLAAQPENNSDATALAAMLREAVRGEEGVQPALRQAGIPPAEDGTLTLDGQLNAALGLQADAAPPALNGLVARVEEAAARLLGDIQADATASFVAQASRGEQAGDPSWTDLRQQLAVQLTGTDNYAARTAVASYVTISTL